MTTKQVAVLMYLLLALSTIAGAHYSSSFPIGTYSYLGNKSLVYDYRDEYCVFMKDLGFNTNIIEIFSPHSTTVTDYADLYHKLNLNGLDSIIMDKRWSASDTYSTYALSTGSYYRFEAEYTDGNAVQEDDNVDSKYWYRSSWYKGNHSANHPRTGEHNSSPIVRDYWLCNKNTHVPGYAYGDLYYRWDAYSLYLRNVGKEFYIKKLETPDTDNFLYINYSFYISDINPGLPMNTPLLTFAPTAFSYPSNALTAISHYYGSTLAENTDFTYGDYLATGVGDENRINCTIKISYSKLIELNLVYPDDVEGTNSWKIVLHNINPRLYWAGNCNLRLDYIEIEDQLFHNMKEVDAAGAITLKEEYKNGMLSAISTLVPNDYINNFAGILSLDEPRQGQWESFRMVQNALPTSMDIMTATYDQHYRVFKMDVAGVEKYYSHIDAFKSVATPKIIMPDIYPLRAIDGYTNWNSADNSSFDLQDLLDEKIVSNYKLARYNDSLAQSNKFYPVVQAFGNWKNNRWNEHILPPPAMQKMLLYLPLCFKPDGIFSYRLFGYNWISPTPSSPPIDIASLITDYYPDNTASAPVVNLPVYNAVKEANKKIAVYGNIINNSSNNLNWLGSNTLGLSSGYPDGNVSGLPLSEIKVLSEPSIQLYQGFVQCGYYQDTLGNNSFMIVNRRANYFNDIDHSSPIYVPLGDYETSFPEFNYQTVAFTLNASAYTNYGSFPALYDPADSLIYVSSLDSILVAINPGDGKLLQMCSSLPPVVTGNSTVKNIAYLSGDIDIETGATVTILPGTITTVFPQSTITVKSGAQLSIAGEVTIQDSVSIIVESGGSISFDEAVCTWGENSGIVVTDGDLTIQSSASDKTAGAANWKGIRVTGSDLVNISDATISNSKQNMIVNANTIIHNCNFTVPADAWGLVLGNAVTGYQTEIVNTEQGFGFTGVLGLSSKGISLLRMENAVLINNVDFTNLLYGIHKSSYSTTLDTISVCSFHNCGTGIYMINKVSGATITQCSFANNYEEETGTGIDLQASSPMVSSCSFIKLQRGLRTEFNLPGSMPVRSNITGSLFYNCDSGIVSRNSNYRLEENYFNRNEVGIVNHAGSNLSLSYGANNVLMNSDANIEFYDTMPYESTIQLFNGHNDFYHLENSNAFDFCFDTNYYNFPRVPNHQINASRNWFDDNVFTVNDTLYLGNVMVASYDPTPSMPAPPPESDRLYTALSLEFEGSYDSAIVYYAAIIDDQLESEKSYVTSAIDGLYRCRILRSDPIWALSDYFSSQAVQYAIDEPELSAVFQDYLCKTLVLDNEFQAAVDLIQIRIDNPVSEIDSLRAVLDLEIVLQLAAMEESKRPIVTDYVQYKYSDLQVFKVMHESTWDIYESLLEAKDEPSTIPISSMPLIKSNYPNPFNPSTTIEYSIPSAGKAKLCVYNIRGQKVTTLFDGTAEKGVHRLVWDGRDGSGRSVASGIYLILLESSGKSSIRKAMLLK
jgi:hypothetical protein